MNILKNRFVIGCFCIILSIALGGFVVPKLSEKILTDTVSVVIAKNNLSENYKITADDLEVVQINAASPLPDGYASSTEEFLEKYTVSMIQAGDVLTASKVSESSEDGSDFISEVSGDENTYAVSVDISGYSAGVAGNIQTGDVVTIFDSAGNTYKEVYYMQIVGIADSDGRKPSDAEFSEPAVITFRGNIVQVSKLAGLSQQDSVYLALAARYSADSKKAEELLESQKKLFEEDEYYRELLELSGMKSQRVSDGA